MGCLLRLAELTFFLYSIIHVGITILFDSQVVNPQKEWYPEQVLNMTAWYVKEYKDPYFVNPPMWYKSFCYMEMFAQFPYLIVACYAFLKGKCQWIRIPTLIYATHVATTLLPILFSIAFDDFSKMGRVGPSTTEERMKLALFYIPYLVIPLLQILVMSFSDTYSGKTQTPVGKATSSKKKHQKSH